MQTGQSDTSRCHGAEWSERDERVAGKQRVKFVTGI